VYVAPEPEPEPEPTALQACFNAVPTIGKQPHLDRWTDYPGAASNLNSVNINYTITFKNCNGFSIKAYIFKSEGRVSFQNIAYASTSLGTYTTYSAPHNVLTPQTLSNATHQVTGQFTTGVDGFHDFVVAHGASGVPQSKCFITKCVDSSTYANPWYSTYDAQGVSRSGTTCDFIPQYHSQTVPLAPTPFTPSINFEVEAVDANVGTFTLKFRYSGSNTSAIADLGNMFAKIHKRTQGPTPNNSVTNNTLTTSETTKVFAGSDLESSPNPPSFLFFWGTSSSLNYINNATINGGCISSVKRIGNQLRLVNFIPLCTEVHIDLQ
jgi:hypothetical protein